jgi:hypothetical protein
MKKFQVTIEFELNEEFMQLVPQHRAWINTLIKNNIIDQYVVSMEARHVWITLGAKDKKEVKELLSKSPLFKYWQWRIDELILFDGQHYRLPQVQLN